VVEIGSARFRETIKGTVSNHITLAILKINSAIFPYRNIHANTYTLVFSMSRLLALV